MREAMCGHLYCDNPAAFVLSALFLIWLVALAIQSAAGLMRRKLTGAQVIGFVLVAAGLVWMFFTLASVNVGWLFGNLTLPDPWFLLGGILLIYGFRYLLAGKTKELVSLVIALAVIISGFYVFGHTTPPTWNGWRVPFHSPEFSSPNPSPSDIGRLRVTPTEELDWAEVNASALFFGSSFGSIYLGQRDRVGFGTYLYTYTNQGDNIYALKPVDGNRFGGLFLGSQVTTATLAVDFGNVYAKIDRSMDALCLITKAGDIKLSTATVVPQITIKSHASNIRVEVPQGVKVVLSNESKGVFVGNMVNGSGDGSAGTITLNLDVRAGNVYITELP